MSYLAGASLLLAALGLTGCQRAQTQDTTASPSTSDSATSSTVAAAPSSSASTQPSATSTTPVGFNGRCEDLLPLSLVTDALQRPVVGRTSSIVGVAEPNIGRLAYLNCKYGITTATVKKKPVTTTGVEIGLSLYSTAQQAAKRVQATVDYYLSLGASAHPIRVGQNAGQIMLGVGDTLIVVAAGPRTAAISVTAKILGAGIAAELASLANAVFGATAQFNQGAAASTDASSGSASGSASMTPSAPSS